MTTKHNLHMSEQFINELRDKSFHYVGIDSDTIGLRADNDVYPQFVKDNILFHSTSIEECLAWLQGVFNPFTIFIIDPKKRMPKGKKK